MKIDYFIKKTIMQQSPNETPSTEEIERKFILREIPEFMKVQLSKYILQ
jgi:hypothetical protein